MSELISPKKTSYQRKNLSKSAPRQHGSTVQLTFHVPEGMKEKLDFNLGKESIKEELEELKKIEAMKIADALRKIEAIEAVEQLDIAEVKYIESETTSNKLDSIEEASIVGPSPIIAKEKLHINELNDDVLPYLSLKLKNQQMVYKIGQSFIQDIQAGLKNFAFSTLAERTDDRHLLVYASFINYSLKQPVLVVVKDFKDKSLDKFRANFTSGTLWNWNTKDWGNLCFVDYNEILKYAEEFNTVDLSFITHEFSAVLWTLPEGNIQDELQKATLPILGKLDSVTFIVSKGKTTNKNVKKAATYYQCFSIPVKGILVGEGEIEE